MSVYMPQPTITNRTLRPLKTVVIFTVFTVYNVGLQATTYDHKQDTATVEQPKLLPHCDQDLHAALLVWQNALRKLEAVHLAPTAFKLLGGLHKLISKLAPEFRQMLKQAEFIDKSNGKPPWTHVELLQHLHRHAAEALQYPRPAIERDCTLRLS